MEGRDGTAAVGGDVAAWWWHRGRTLQGLFAPRYAMKCLDKKRIKMKQGETLALNERIMLSLVSTGVRGHRAGTPVTGRGTGEGGCPRGTA